ncbi:MAG: hypothetical protein Q9216_001624 [Gyalolechia sp. 2 TL-2023]
MLDVLSFFDGLQVAGVILSLCVPIPIFYRRNRVSRAVGELYSDEDGESTRETHSAFFRRSRNHVLTHLTMSVIGLGINCVAAVLRFGQEPNIPERSRRFEVSVWIFASLLLASHGVVIAHTSSSIDRQNQGALSGCCSVFIYSADVWYDLQEFAEPRIRLLFSILHLVLLLASITVNFTIPRRPLVFRDGEPSRPVDSEKTVSVLSRLTLSWANARLSYAMRRGGLDFQDLPYLKARMLTQALASHFKEVTSDRRLWRTIIVAHRSTFGWQWLLTTLRSFASLAPQYFMYRLILILEADPVHDGPNVVVWLALLGFAQLAYPYRSMVIMAWMSMRKKDTKGIKRNDPEVNGKESLNGPRDRDLQGHEAPRDVQQDSTLVGSLDEINLMSVDVERVSDFLSYNGMVSLGRIEAFINSLERVDETINADSVSFDDVSIGWPSDETSSRSFMLHNLNFTFPNHELSLIVGPTGAGKSLLLQAIIGEVDIFNGAVRRPHPSLDHPIQSVILLGEDWILPKHTVFVAQTAWIENGTLRANVLFGLPFYHSRFVAVLDACTFSPDIAAMENGDLTEIGSHGVNLSGGQRSRLTMARALYSRAEVIVMDDVFSAVDAHVGQHILEHALTGEIMR